MTTDDPYAASALFRCDEGHGTFRRDQCRSRRGQLECPRCLIGAVVGTLRYVEPTPSPQPKSVED